jgi:hypothetical protein
MTRNADRKNAIAALRAAQPELSHRAAARQLDQHAADTAAKNRPSAPSSRVVAALQRARNDVTVGPAWRPVFRRLLADTENIRLRAPSGRDASGRWVSMPLRSYRHARELGWLQMTYAYAARAHAMLAAVATGREPHGIGHLLPGEPPARPDYTPDIDTSAPPAVGIPDALPDHTDPHLRAAQEALAAVPLEAAGASDLDDEAMLRHAVCLLSYADAVVLYLVSRELPMTSVMPVPLSTS